MLQMCDSFSRIGAWALLGMCLRPIGAKLHGIQQPYLPLILAAELLLITAVFKSRSFGLNLAWSELFKKEYLVSVMACFLGTYWCCNTADLAAQHRLSRSLLALRIMQTLGILWLCAWSFSIAVGSDCLAVEQPAVVIVALLVLFTFALAFLTALAHDVAMSLFALPFFPIIAGRRVDAWSWQRGSVWRRRFHACCGLPRKTTMAWRRCARLLRLDRAR